MIKKYFIITGASKGLGRALSLELADSDVVLFLIAKKGLAKVGKLARYRGASVEERLFDLRKIDGLEGLIGHIFTKIKKSRASLVVLINNAGVVSPIAFAGNAKTKDVSDSLKINCISPIILSSIFIRKVKNFNCKKMIVNISSGAAKKVFEGWSPYCSAKASLEMFSNCVSSEQKRLKNGVKVYSIDPGVINTGMQEKIRGVDASEFPAVNKFIEWYKKGILRPPEAAAKDINKIFWAP